MRHVLLPVIGAFRARYPEIRLVLNTSEDLIDLIEQRTDLAFRIGTLSDSSLHARSLGQYRLRILAAPAYLEKYGWPLQASDLPHHQLIGFSQPESLNDWPLQHDVQQSYRIQPALTASNGEIVRELALAGEGIACLADFMTGEDRRSGRLVQVLEPVTREFFQPVNAVYYRHTELSARIRVFLDFLSHSLAVNEDKLAPAR
jgi:DNA-binding transcriptional LysR family regulator